MDTLSITEAEDSSYDSECDTDASHEQVSRTTSDTLGQEFSEYVGQPQGQLVRPGKVERPSSYTQRVEFALKLGYTERLVQIALVRLGPDPTQNELLAELIKLGAQHGTKCDLSDSQSQTTKTFDLHSSNSNIACKNEDIESLRPIVIDGSNVAYCHGNKEVFSCLGIRLCVDWFRIRGHKEITVFVPKFRKENPRPDNPIKDQEILFELEKERMLVYTPSRFMGGKKYVCYDDRYILKLASENDGIVVSNDNYRDLANESIEFKRVVEERVLMYSFVSNLFMPPDDPLGRSGPTLDNFLRFQPKKGDTLPSCPYGKKCTYGNKCKFNHPERGIGPHKSITERLSEHAAWHLSARCIDDNNKVAVRGKSLSVPLNSASLELNTARQKPLARAYSCVRDDCKVSACNETIPNQHSSQQDPQLAFSSRQTNNDQNCKIDVKSTYSEPCLTENKSSRLSTIQHSVCRNVYGNEQQSASFLHYPDGPSVQSVTSCQNQPNVLEPNDNINLHKKLQRQLSLNPNTSEQLFPIERRQQQQKLHIPGHRPLISSYSARTPIPSHDMHQNLTRIASAPNASANWQKSAIPQDNVPWIHQPSVNTHGATTLSTQANRLHIQYHLSSLFPEQQVAAAMEMFPEETNPQNICAAILNMFPKI